MDHVHLKTALTALVLAVGLPALTACSDAQPPMEEVEQTGTLSAALLTAGSDGATYQFPAGTELVLRQGSYNESVAVDGGETVLNVLVPVGTLTVDMSFPSGTPQLRRTVGGVTTTVDATWADPQPATVAITLGGTTNLTLHFEVTGLGDV